MPPPKPPPTRYEVLNFGVVGYNTVRIVESVRTKVLKYSPDLILYVYCLNDPQEYSFDQQSLLAQRGPAARNSRAREGRGLIERSRFLRTVMYMMRTAAEGKAIRRMPDWWRDDPQALSLQDASHVRYFSRLHSDPSTWAPVARALDGLAAMTRARRIPVVLPIVPMFFELEDVGSRLTKVRDRVALEASDRLFHPVDLFEPYAAHGRAGLPTLNLDATHLTVEGNRYTAMILAASLLGAGLLPREVSLRDVLASATLEDRYRVLLGRVLDPARTGSPAEPAKRVSPRPAEANLSR
ncbi:MAG: hypothetical protein HY815_14815 [Candidatus Riflebacteria bacterium]|nr:hypothetical protein [Candidatus Riflebacteria bacterium]